MVSVSALEDCLECPVCLDVPDSAPVYQCENGHIVCKNCHSQLVECPPCRAPMGAMRSLLAEKLLETVPKKCTYARNGCKEW